MSGLARRLPALWRGGMANGSSDQSLSAVELGEAGSSAGPRDIAQASSAGELGDTEEQPPLQSFLGLFLAGAPGSPKLRKGIVARMMQQSIQKSERGPRKQVIRKVR